MPCECYHTVLRHWLVMADGRLSLVYQLWSVQLSTQKARRLWGCLAGPVSFSFAVPKFSWCSDPKSKVLDLTLGHKTSVQRSLKKKKDNRKTPTKIIPTEQSNCFAFLWQRMKTCLNLIQLWWRPGIFTARQMLFPWLPLYVTDLLCLGRLRSCFGWWTIRKPQNQ